MGCEAHFKQAVLPCCVTLCERIISVTAEPKRFLGFYWEGGGGGHTHTFGRMRIDQTPDAHLWMVGGSGSSRPRIEPWAFCEATLHHRNF